MAIRTTALSRRRDGWVVLTITAIVVGIVIGRLSTLLLHERFIMQTFVQWNAELAASPPSSKVFSATVRNIQLEIGKSLSYDVHLSSTTPVWIYRSLTAFSLEGALRLDKGGDWYGLDLNIWLRVSPPDWGLEDLIRLEPGSPIVYSIQYDLNDDRGNYWWLFFGYEGWPWKRVVRQSIPPGTYSASRVLRVSYYSTDPREDVSAQEKTEQWVMKFDLTVPKDGG